MNGIHKSSVSAYLSHDCSQRIAPGLIRQSCCKLVVLLLFLYQLSLLTSPLICSKSTVTSYSDTLQNMAPDHIHQEDPEPASEHPKLWEDEFSDMGSALQRGTASVLDAVSKLIVKDQSVYDSENRSLPRFSVEGFLPAAYSDIVNAADEPIGRCLQSLADQIDLHPVYQDSYHEMSYHYNFKNRNVTWKDTQIGPIITFHTTVARKSDSEETNEAKDANESQPAPVTDSQSCRFEYVDGEWRNASGPSMRALIRNIANSGTRESAKSKS